MAAPLLQGGRRRRRRARGLAWFGAVALLAVAATLLLADRGAEGPGSGLASSAGASTSPVPVAASPGTAAAPLAVRLDVTEDPVRDGFRRPPRAGLLFDVDSGRVLWRRQAIQRRPIASLTKIMTALVVAERLPASTRVRITREALAYRGSGVGVLPRGGRVRLETLLYGLLLSSGNDAAIALAQRTGRTVPGFVALMNRRASELGLGCTRFSSPDGYRDAGNHSCPADLAALARAVLRVPRLARIVRHRDAALRMPIKGGRVFLSNHNPLLRAGYRGTTGIKTGYTDRAGRCLVATVRRGHVRLGVVLLDSPDPGRQARHLLDRGFRAARVG